MQLAEALAISFMFTHEEPWKVPSLGSQDALTKRRQSAGASPSPRKAVSWERPLSKLLRDN